MSLDAFSEPVRAWFSSNFGQPTPVQNLGWPVIGAGDHCLIAAPTGSGKTLAAFLWGIDRLAGSPVPDREHRTRVLYISPLRALAFDVEKNLRAPMAGIGLAAERLGVAFTEPVVALRTGDTAAKDRAGLIRRPPDILITTPESLYLMLTSSGREVLAGVETVIIDEIHALAPTKRGAHLALSLERLEQVCARPPQRIGLSATQRPLEEVARFLGGFSEGRPRPVSIVDAGVRKPLELTVCVPIEDMGDLGAVLDGPQSGPTSAAPARRSIWPSIHPAILELIQSHRTTIVFANARRLAERLAARLNELAGGDELVKAHHGSLAREQRVVIEDQLKRGELRAIVATSSLELGIDMGAVDLVIQVESPGAVSRGLQRIGRAGHSVGEASKGTIFPKHRGDLLETAVVVERMDAGLIERTRYLRNPLDVLAQQIVAELAMGERAETDLRALVAGCASFADLGDEVWAAVLDLLAGRYPSEEFSELRPRIVWDRSAGMLRARDGSRRLAVTSGGTIPDRGLFGVFLPDGTRVGELDEEMVYESRAGETFLLGASTWRIEDITFERVIVTPAPGLPGKMPFWHGDRPGRPLELGEALGAFVREVRALPRADAERRLGERNHLDSWARDNLLSYLAEQAAATGAVPDDRTVVIERFRDEIGDYRICILTPFGTPVHAPWTMAIRARVAERTGFDVEAMWSDDGIVLRLPESMEHLDLSDIVIDPDEIEAMVLAALPSTSLFAARFRECAARALLLPRRRPDRRTPLWQQRQRAADLLAVSSRYPTFPILLETSRECLQDVFDVPALRTVLDGLRTRRIRIVETDTAKASPFAQSLLFNWIAAYMYEGDAPLAERRAAALALDRDLLRELLGSEELRDLIDPDVLTSLEDELQRRQHLVATVDDLADLLRLLGPLRTDELVERHVPVELVTQLVGARQAIVVNIGGVEHVAAAQDAARLRDGLGVSIPLGLPAAFTDPVPAPLEELVARFARTHGPFETGDVVLRLAAPLARIHAALGSLESAGRVVRGEFLRRQADTQFVDVDVLAMLRRRSLAALRREIEPVEPQALARFLPAWQWVSGSGGSRRGVDAVVEAVAQLQGAPLMASTLDAEVLGSRVSGYREADLDQLCAAGDVVWIGAGASGARDGRLRLFFRDQVGLLAPEPTEERPAEPLHQAICEHLSTRGPSFWAQLVAAAPGSTETELLAALWDLVWAGVVTNDSFAPLRAVVRARGQAPRATGRPRPGRLRSIGPPSGAGRWSLVGDLLIDPPAPTARRHAQAMQLLERHGVLTREAVRAEQFPGGFAAVYGLLRLLEERGQVRRGYFVAGLGAAQFALPGAVDRLRERVEQPEYLVLAAGDPAQAYGAALAWPPSPVRPTRVASAAVVLRSGELVAWVDRSSHQLLVFDQADTSWAHQLAGWVTGGRWSTLEIRKFNGAEVRDRPEADLLRSVGFRDGYKGLVLRSR